MSVYGSRLWRARFQWAPTLTDHPDSFVITIESPATGDQFDTVTNVLIGVTSVTLEALTETLPIGVTVGVTSTLEAFGEALPIGLMIGTHPTPAEAFGEALPIGLLVLSHPALIEAFGESATNAMNGVQSIVNESLVELIGTTLAGVTSVQDAYAEVLPILLGTGVHTLGSESLSELLAASALTGAHSLGSEAFAELLLQNILIGLHNQTTDDAPGGPGGTVPGTWWRMRRRRMPT